MFYLTMHSTHFFKNFLRLCGVGHMAKDLLYASSPRQDCIYHSLWYTSREALAGMRNSSKDPP